MPTRVFDSPFYALTVRRRRLSTSSLALFLASASLCHLAGCSAGPSSEGEGAPRPLPGEGSPEGPLAQTTAPLGALTCVTVQRGVAGAVADAHIASEKPTKNYGTGLTGVVGVTSTGDKRTFYVDFDFGAVPPGADIKSATLTLKEAYTFLSGPVEIHEVLAPWSEDTVTWNSLTPSPNTIASAIVASGSMGDGTKVHTYDVLSSVQGWRATPGSQHGFAITSPGNASHFVNFYSSEWSNTVDRPKLEVCYEAGGVCVNGAQQSCYTGVAGTEGVGQCQAGVQTCTSGAWGACTGEVTPGAETCDGVDNDCDGLIDEGNPGGGQGCDTGVPGVCGAGLTTCAGGQIACQPTAQPGAETCDGVDNDCDGAVDEGIPSTPCDTGLYGVCADGMTACANGASTCVQTTPAAVNEDCANALDDTCDGQVNEGCVCTPNAKASCYTGPAGTDGVGLCKAGTMTCNAQGTAWGPCVGEVFPTTESCATVGDDDCDGQTNEGCVCTPFTSQSCYSGPAGTAGVGLCKSGTRTCNAQGTGYGACTGEVVPTTETCQTKGDDDCDGQTNEGCAALTCDLFTETFDPGSHTISTPYFKADWCNETVVLASNMPLCMAGTKGMRTNGTSTSAQLWVSRGNSSCTGVKISYQWYQFAQSTSSLQYQQSSDSSFATCPSGSFTTIVSAASQSALQTCSSTTVTVPFSVDPTKNSVYIKFNNANASNNAMWYDNVSVQLVGCPCN